MKKDRDRFNLIGDIGDLSAMMMESSDIGSFLQNTVLMISRYVSADVCSIYLFDEKSEELVLKATVGLNMEAVEKIRMKPGEGLVGKTYERMQTIHEASAKLHPGFKYFKAAEEERFESFLSVPIRRGNRKIGVLVVQKEQSDYFNKIDVVVLRALASQLAGALENICFLTDLCKLDEKPAKSSENDISETNLRFIEGEPASEGYAFALSTIFTRSHGELLVDNSESDDIYSLGDFYTAVQKTSDQLIEFQNRLTDQLLESASLIFDAHFMMLKDAQFINKIVQHIMDGLSPPKAVKEVAGHYIDIFSSSSNEYIREKVTDMEDLASRILKNLYNWSPEDAGFNEDRIVIAQDLYPSEILKLASEDIRGIILVRGGVTSHVSILSRSLKIPMIIADRPELLNLKKGTPILLNAAVGNIYIRPSEEVIRQFENRKKKQVSDSLLKCDMSPTTRTQDGVRVHLLANINLLSELAAARDLKAEGVGLYRTEFPFLIRSTFPSEEEQYLIYKRLFDEMPDQEITIRTLDIGDDKIPTHSTSLFGENLELGLRSIRFSLRHRDIFEHQLRAILRASAESEHVRIMFPMISSLDEFREAKQVVLDCIVSLKRENLSYHPAPAIGMMVELPSVLGIIREFAREADFFSIGTNDFVQYMLAVNRANEKVADYYCPHHPSVMRGLAKIFKAAKSENKDISICGEMAHELEYISFLLGIGARKISVDPQFLPIIQKKITSLKITDTEEHAKAILLESTLKGTRKMLKNKMPLKGPESEQ